MSKIPRKEKRIFDSQVALWDTAVETFQFHSLMQQKALEQMNKINDKIYPFEEKYGVNRNNKK